MNSDSQINPGQRQRPDSSLSSSLVSYMAPSSHYGNSQPPIAAQRVTSPAVGGRRKASAPTKPVVVHQQPSGDVYYGYEDLSIMCGKFITDLFSCPAVPIFANTTSSTIAPSNSSSSGSPSNCPPLANFIAYAIHRTRLPEVVVFTALFLLSRLKDRFPAARGSSGHRLFISAFMIASKVVCDDTYSNKSWCIVGQNLYTLKEVNQMEREMCSYLEWILHVEATELKVFEDKVRGTYGPEAGVNPPKWVSPTATATTTAATAPLVISTSTAVAEPVSPTDAAARAAYPSPTSSSPPTPTHSDSTSPASSNDECPTPPPDDVMSIATTGAPSISSVNDKQSKHHHIQQQPIIAAPMDPSFAYAGPTVW